MHHHEGALSPQFAVLGIKVTGTIVRVDTSCFATWHLPSKKAPEFGSLRWGYFMTNL